MKAHTFVHSILFSLLFAFTILTVSIAFAVPAQAQTIDATLVQTSQLLPPGGNSCAQLPVTGFTPYVYDGALHAFEFDVPDSSYVAIGGTVGDTVIPFNHLLRMTNGAGNLRVHADIATTPIQGSLIVSVTMLSAKGPTQPVCMSVVISGVADQGGTAPVTATPSTPSIPATPAPSVSETPEEVIDEESIEEEPTTDDEEESMEETSATSTSAVTTMANSISDYCLGGGALKLWIILLVVYALVVLGTILGQPKLPTTFRSQEWTATAIVVPFLLLFGFWYFAESCRTSAWIPVAATVIALAGLSAAFWERKGSGTPPSPSTTVKSTNVINLPGAKK